MKAEEFYSDEELVAAIRQNENLNKAIALFTRIIQKNLVLFLLIMAPASRKRRMFSRKRLLHLWT